MTFKEFTTRVAAELDISKVHGVEVVAVIRDMIAQAILKDKRFVFPGLGTFKIVKRKARTCMNPQNGTKIKVPAKSVLRFKASPKFIMK